MTTLVLVCGAARAVLGSVEGPVSAPSPATPAPGAAPAPPGAAAAEPPPPAGEPALRILEIQAQGHPRPAPPPGAAPPSQQHAAPGPASPTGERAPPGRRAGRRWYGLQTLALDGLAAVLVIGSGAWDLDGLYPAGVLTYLFGPPVLHWSRGKAVTGFISLGTRLAAPLVLGLVGYGIGVQVEDSEDSWAPLVGLALGVLHGYAFAVASDPVFLAYDDDDAAVAPQQAARARPRARLHLAPTFALGGGRAGLGVAGSF